MEECELKRVALIIYALSSSISIPNFNTNIFVRTDNVPQSKNKIKFI